MGAGLLQIVNTGFADIFLTKKPEITFFKIVFLRYTPFAIETIEETFDGYGNFGESITCNLSKCGDLINKIWVRIDLPVVNIPKINISDKTILINQVSNSQTLFNSFQTFMSYVFKVWRNLLLEVSSSAGTYTTILAVINNFMISDMWNQYVLYNVQFNNIQVNTDTVNFDIINVFNTLYKTQYQYSIYSAVDTSNFKTILYNFLQTLLYQANTYNKILFNKITYNKNLLTVASKSSYNFSWVQKIGFALLEECQIEIGGQIIDRINSDILNIWYELSLGNNQRTIFNKLIGDIDVLTTYGTTPYYTLYVPIPFWFCRYNGAALPAVALRYHDIIINIKLRELSKCCYFEENNNININEIIKLPYVSLYVDYIYIDQPEREKFGQKQLEYLIEEHQTIIYKNLSTQIINNILNFVNPVKEIFWVIQSTNSLNVYKTWNKYNLPSESMFDAVQSHNLGILLLGVFNFKIGDNIIITRSLYYNGKYKIKSISELGIIVGGNFINTDSGLISNQLEENTITNSTLMLNGIPIIDNVPVEYLNLVQPYQCHTNTPSLGIYVYSFSLHPEEFQPSGTCNLGLVSSTELYNVLNPKLYKRIFDQKDSLILKVFAKNLNILKITKGMAMLEFGI